jgi:hypothetical protein
VLAPPASGGGVGALEEVVAGLAEALAAHGMDVAAPAPGPAWVRAPYRLPALSPAADLRPAVAELAVAEAAAAARRAEAGAAAIKCDGCPRLDAQWAAHARVRRLASQLAAVRARFSVEALALYPEMQARFAVLRRLGYTAAAAPTPSEGAGGEHTDAQKSRHALDVVALKGRVAAEVNTADELIFTEALFEGLLSPLSPAEAAALLSVLVFQDRSGARDAPMPDFAAAADAAAAAASLAKRSAAPEEPEESVHDGEAEDGTPAEEEGGDAPATAADDAAASDQPAIVETVTAAYSGPVITSVTPQLLRACGQLQAIAFALGRLQADAGIPIIPSEYVREKLNFGLLLPTYAWACGVPFATICELTDVAEGTIVRSITRLDETCREVRNAARIMGDPLLFRKMETASSCIKRDVIFAGSLYLN